MESQNAAKPYIRILKSSASQASQREPQKGKVIVHMGSSTLKSASESHASMSDGGYMAPFTQTLNNQSHVVQNVTVYDKLNSRENLTNTIRSQGNSNSNDSSNISKMKSLPASQKTIRITKANASIGIGHHTKPQTGKFTVHLGSRTIRCSAIESHAPSSESGSMVPSTQTLTNSQSPLLNDVTMNVKPNSQVDLTKSIQYKPDSKSNNCRNINNTKSLPPAKKPFRILKSSASIPIESQKKLQELWSKVKVHSRSKRIVSNSQAAGASEGHLVPSSQTFTNRQGYFPNNVSSCDKLNSQQNPTNITQFQADINSNDSMKMKSLPAAKKPYRILKSSASIVTESQMEPHSGRVTVHKGSGTPKCSASHSQTAGGRGGHMTPSTQTFTNSQSHFANNISMYDKPNSLEANNNQLQADNNSSDCASNKKRELLFAAKTPVRILKPSVSMAIQSQKKPQLQADINSNDCSSNKMMESVPSAKTPVRILKSSVSMAIQTQKKPQLQADINSNDCSSNKKMESAPAAKTPFNILKYSVSMASQSQKEPQLQADINSNDCSSIKKVESLSAAKKPFHILNSSATMAIKSQNEPQTERVTVHMGSHTLKSSACESHPSGSGEEHMVLSTETSTISQSHGSDVTMYDMSKSHENPTNTIQPLDDSSSNEYLIVYDHVFNITCKKCKNKFNFEFKYVLHKNQIPLVCPNSNCEQKFCVTHTIADHMRAQAPKQFKCRKCGEFIESDDAQHVESFAKFKHAGAKIRPETSKPGPKPLPSSGPYQCSKCTNVFPSKKSLKDHISLKHMPILEYRCDRCEKEFISLDFLRSHMFSQHMSIAYVKIPENFDVITENFDVQYGPDKANIIKCEICDEVFTTVFAYMEHQTKGHFPCPEDDCQEVFAHKHSLIHHMKKHQRRCTQCGCNLHKGRRMILKCRSCAKGKDISSIHDRIEGVTRITDYNNQKSESKRKNGSIDYICQECNLSFRRHYQLKTHVKNVHATNSTCNECRMTFSCPKLLHRHIDMHNGKRRPKCDQCDMYFEDRERFSIHMKCHADVQPYKCVIKGCEREFILRQHFEEHNKTHNKHQFSDYHECPECGRYYHQDSFLMHMRSKHLDKMPYMCDTCQKGFMYKASLMRHAQHPRFCRPWTKRVTQNRSSTAMGNIKNITCSPIFKCPIRTCRRSFSSKLNLYTHTRIHLKFACPIKDCRQTFVSMKEVSEHQKIHPFWVCYTCVKVFVSRKSLYKHVKTLLHRRKINKPLKNKLGETSKDVQTDCVKTENLDKSAVQGETVCVKVENIDKSQYTEIIKECYVKLENIDGIHRQFHKDDLVLENLENSPMKVEADCSKLKNTDGAPKEVHADKLQNLSEFLGEYAEDYDGMLPNLEMSPKEEDFAELKNLNKSPVEVDFAELKNLNESPMEVDFAELKNLTESPMEELTKQTDNTKLEDIVVNIMDDQTDDVMLGTKGGSPQNIQIDDVKLENYF